MYIHTMQIPQGGTLHLEGEEDAASLGLEEACAEAVGPLRYSLDVGLSDGGLWAAGRLAVRVRFTCVVTLEPFERDIVIDPFAMQKIIGSEERIDITPEIREDIHLALPTHPRADNAAFEPTSVVSQSAPQRDGGDPWAALEKFKK